MGIFSSIKDSTFGKQREHPIPPAAHATTPATIAPATTMATPATAPLEPVDVTTIPILRKKGNKKRRLV